MNYQVLSIGQMKELESLGINTSDSSCMWTSVQDKDYNPVSWLVVWRGPEAKTLEEMREAFPLTFKKGNAYYTYTLEDILAKLPKPCYITCIDEDFYQCEYETSTTNGKTSLTAAFNMLKWCKQNNEL